MSGNTIGKLFTVTSFGESHGPAIGCVVDGCPPGLELSAADLQVDLDRRKPGKNRFTTQRREADEVRILSGIFEGKTTGTPIGMIIDQKYGIRDYRGGGRSSARETAMRVAAGGIAKKYLKSRLDVDIRGYLSQLGPIECGLEDWTVVDENPFFCAEPGKITELEQYMDALRREGNSIGAKITVVATGLPPGLGEPVFDRLDAEIAAGLMSINAVKGVEIGDGFASVTQKGTEHRDEMTPAGFLSNHAGGIVGGISTGQDIVAHLALKPTSSITIPGKTVDSAGNAVDIVTKGRHDPCVGIRAVPIAEAMLAITLLDHLLRHRGQNADVTPGAPVLPPTSER